MKARGIFGSLEARGKFGDIMVAFPWKDIQVIRVLKYPAQPRTPLVRAQRTHMTNAVAEWKATLYTAADQSAWVKRAGLRPKGETGPNQMIREHIAVSREALTWSRLRDGDRIDQLPTDGQLRIIGDAALANVQVRYGSNIRYMYNIAVCNWDGVALRWTINIPAGTFTAGTRVYFQFYDGATFDERIGSTGIYSYDQPAG